MVAKQLFAIALIGASVVSAQKPTDFDAYKSLPYTNTPPPACPPPSLASKADFNLTAYVDGRWYIQEQMPVAYLDEESLYCVSARYEALESGVSDAKVLQPLLSWLKYSPDEIPINVYNYANKKQVNGENQIGNLKAVALNPQTAPAELMVGPKFLPRWFWGPYWVMAAGPGPDNYTWALVSGGLPEETGEGGYCKTGDGINGSGLWIFTREKIASPETVQAIRGIAKGLGYDVSVLLHVEQKGCLYDGIQEA